MPRYIFTPSAVATGGTYVPVSFYLHSPDVARVTDLYLINGTDAITFGIPNGVIIPDPQTGAITPFAGPNDIDTLYLQIGNNSGSRTMLTAARSSGDQPAGGSGGGGIPTNRTVATGTGLSGGGDLSTNRTISAVFGTATGTVAQGNDSRLSDARVPLAHATSHLAAGSDPLTLAQSQVTNLTTNLAAKADLVGGKVPSAQIPPIQASGATYVVASQAAMLALTANNGDVAVRTDLTKSYILSAQPPSTLGNWIELVGTGAVSSVAGKTGTVSLVAADVGAVPTTTTVTAGTGLTGGGDLSANRSLAVSFGSTSTTVSAGNHQHAGTDIISGTINAAYLPSLPISLMPAGTNITVFKTSGTWPSRPTSRADIIVRWSGVDPSPGIVESGTAGMLDNVDIREIPAS